MSLKIQFVKCILCVILYIIIYIILLRLKQNYLTQYSSSLFFANNQTKQECSLVSQSVIKRINLEIELLEYDEMKGESINLQVSNSLYYII